MRAIVVDEFGPPEGLRVAEMPVPQPGPGEVLVEVHMAPVNYVDLLVVGGTYQSLPARPFIPGKGPAGVVAAFGPGVATPQIGDRVLAMAEEGGYAQAVALRADQCYHLPPGMSFAEAASLSLVYDTAWFALRERARLAPGETVLVLGASGGVGQAAVQLARAMGARVLAGFSRPERAPVARAAGADAIIDSVARKFARHFARPGLGSDRRARRRCHSRSARRRCVRRGAAGARLVRPASGDRLCRGSNPDG